MRLYKLKCKLFMNKINKTPTQALHQITCAGVVILRSFVVEQCRRFALHSINEFYSEKSLFANNFLIFQRGSQIDGIQFLLVRTKNESTFQFLEFPKIRFVFLSGIRSVQTP